MQPLISPQEYEALLREQLPPWQKNFTSDDYTDYTWHCPTARLYVGRAMLQTPDAGLRVSGLGVQRHRREAACIDPMIMTGQDHRRDRARAADDPEALQRCRAEFHERTGGGVGGDKWLAPLLPRDFQPPDDLRWPEYVTTERGEEWWIPTPPDARSGWSTSIGKPSPAGRD